MNFKEIKLKNKQKKKLWHIRAMLPWTLKLNCKPYITYALLVYDLFSVEETARILKLVVERWSFASCSHSSMFIKPVLVLNSVVHSVSRVYETCFSLLSLSLRSWRRNFWRLEYGYHWRDSALLSEGSSSWYIWLWLDGFLSWKPQL